MEIDYRLAFDMAPVGLVLSRNRTMVDCNRHLCEMFGASREVLIGQSFQVLYPSADEYERLGARMAPILNAKGHYSDNRIMKRANGEVFWCHVSGRALNREDPHASGIWSFEDLSAQRPVKAELTGREREVAARLLDGLTSKEIGLRSLSEAVDSSTPSGRLAVHTLAALAQYEVEQKRLACAAGRRAAIARGRMGGRPRSMDEQKVTVARALMVDGSLSMSDIARQVGVAPSTLYRTLPGGRGSVSVNPVDQSGAAQ